MTSLTLLSLLLVLGSVQGAGVNFPTGYCEGAGDVDNLINAKDVENLASSWTNTQCKNAKGKCCSGDPSGLWNLKDPPYDATYAKYGPAVKCEYCWTGEFHPSVNAKPAVLQSGHMVCSHAKPVDMTNVEVLYSYDSSGVLKERYCSTPTFTCNHPRLPTLPGSGYNILIGMPLPSGANTMDPGYLNAPVFEATYEKCSTTGNQAKSGYWEWSVPDQYTVTEQNTLSLGVMQDSMHDEHTFQKQAKSSLTTSGGGSFMGFGMEFTAGAEWESSTNSLSEGETVEQRYRREAYAHKATVVPYDVDLSQAYLRAITGAYVSGQWSLFFMSYGTHVTTEIISGARYTQVSKFTRRKFEEVSSNQAAYNAGIKASYEGITNGHSGGHSHWKEDREMIQASAYDQYIVSTGGDGAALDDQDSGAYQKAAHNYPAPLSATILPHDVLITVSKWADFQLALKINYPNEPEATVSGFKQKWSSAIEAYCGDDAHKCRIANSLQAPEPMSLTSMFFSSDLYGNVNGNWKGKGVVDYSNMPDFTNYKPLIKISKIHTFCSQTSPGGRFRGIQFEYFDGDRSALTDVLGIKGDSDADAGLDWDNKNNVIDYGEVISAVTVSSGDDVDGVWFTIQNPKESTTRQIGCGYPTDNMKTWNIKSDNRLLAFSGTRVDMPGKNGQAAKTIVKQIQFRSFLYILPTPTPNGEPECQCYTPNQGKTFLNGAKCSDGAFLWCGIDQYCTNADSFPKSQMQAQCSTDRRLSTPHLTLLQAAATPSTNTVPSHEALLQQLEQRKRDSRQHGEPDLNSPRKTQSFMSTGAPQMHPTKESAPHSPPHHHNKGSKWDEAKLELENLVEHVSKELKESMTSELKDVLSKEIKSALGTIQQKQTHLENTLTRMLMHQVENY